MAIRLAVGPSVSMLSPECLARFKEAGFEGVEVGLEAASAGKDAIAGAGLAVACVDTEVALHVTDRKAWEKSNQVLRQAIDTAVSVGAPVVRVFGYEVPKGEGLSSCMGRIGERLAVIAEMAAAAKVSIAIENAGSFVRARDMWQLLETIVHPRIGACLDAGSSAAAGESPMLVVPTLNTRIMHVHVWDHKDGKPVALGTGDAKNKILVERLRGIGYGGWLSVTRQSDATLADAEGLKAMVTLLKTWLGLIVPEVPKVEAKPAAAPAAAKPAEAAKPAAAPTATPPAV